MLLCCCFAEPIGQKPWVTNVQQTKYKQDLNLDEPSHNNDAQPFEFSRDRKRFTGTFLYHQDYRILGDLCFIDAKDRLHVCALIRTGDGSCCSRATNTCCENIIRCWQLNDVDVWTEDLGAQFKPEQISCGEMHGCAFGIDDAMEGSPRVVRCWGYVPLSL